MYGQTEATARLSYLPPECLDEKLGSIGKGLAHVRLEVLRPDGTPVRPGSGEVGEIVACGDSITPGYWNDAEETGRYFRNGKLYTGDMARVDADGFLFLVERGRDFIKAMGNRVSPKEVEEVLAGLPQVVESAVIGVADELWGEAVKAFLVTTRPGCLTADEVRSHCLARLPNYKVPQYVEFLPRLPKTSHGKVDKRRWPAEGEAVNAAALQQQIEELIRGPQYALPQAEKDARLTAILRELCRDVAAHCPPYRRFLDHAQAPPEDWRTLADIPPLPAAMFKRFLLSAVPPEQIVRELHSSATGGQQPSRIVVDKTTAFRQARALVAILKEHVGAKRRPLLVLDAAESAGAGEDLSARGAAIRGLGSLRLGNDLRHAAFARRSTGGGLGRRRDVLRPAWRRGGAAIRLHVHRLDGLRVGSGAAGAAFPGFRRRCCCIPAVGRS